MRPVQARHLVLVVALLGTLAPVAGARARRGPARFRVGAAVGDFSPPLRGKAPAGDKADCDSSGVFNGPRKWAFTEPYSDTNGNGVFDDGEPYDDCNANSRWDGNLLGGGASTPRYYTKVADPVTARAMVVSNGRRTIAVEVLDQEGFFDVYQDAIRAKVAADGIKLGGVFISATHDESAPDTLGLGGVTATTSGTNDYFLAYLINRSAEAIEDAYHAMRPAHLDYTETLQPRNFRQCWSSYPFTDDQHVPIVQAVGTDGHVIATLADVSQHVETLGFNKDPQEVNWVSSDWTHFFRGALERRYGGVAIEMAGAVGSVESPQVFAGPISRIPQRELDGKQPAGCDTLFAAPATHVKLGYAGETKAFGTQLAAAVRRALDRGPVQPSRSSAIWGERANVCLKFDNLLFSAAGALGVFAHRPSYNNGCTQQVPAAPNGTTGGSEIQTQVAAFRLGDGEFFSVPGEVFPFTYLRGFQGPQDMPDPSKPLAPWVMPHLHTRYRFVDGLAEDMVGYIFPPGNAVAIPSQSNPGALSSDSDRFGCSHRDDAEVASASAGTDLGAALVKLLDRHDKPEAIRTGRYVLPDGKLSRNPLGGPELKCNIDTKFQPDGPAVGVQLAGGHEVKPRTWMSLSGLPQKRPDRDTRGYFDRSGRRVWLEVFPDM